MNIVSCMIKETLHDQRDVTLQGLVRWLTKARRVIEGMVKEDGEGV